MYLRDDALELGNGRPDGNVGEAFGKRVRTGPKTEDESAIGKGVERGCGHGELGRTASPYPQDTRSQTQTLRAHGHLGQDNEDVM